MRKENFIVHYSCYNYKNLYPVFQILMMRVVFAMDTNQLIGTAVLILLHACSEAEIVTMTRNVKEIWCVDQKTVLATIHLLEVIG